MPSNVPAADQDNLLSAALNAFKQEVNVPAPGKCPVAHD